MAGPLRKVSRHYLWTIKRAHNDLHYSISPPSASPSESSSTTPTKPIDLSKTSPWDSDRLQWKFKSEYEELCEHFEHSYIILVSWLLTIDHLFRIGLRYFIRHPTHSVAILYERSSEIPISRDLLSSTWNRSVPAFRHVASFVLSRLWDIINSPVYVNSDARHPKDDINVEPPTPIELQDPYANVPGSPTVFGSEHAPLEDKLSATTSDSYHSWIDPPLVDPPKGRLPAATHNVESVLYRRPSHEVYDMSLLKITTTHGNIARVHHSKSPKSTSKQAVAKFVFTGPLVDDVSVLGVENPLAHNPESFAL